MFHSKVYDSEADIYSFGLILWEMWYGQQAFADVPPMSVDAFFKQVHQGYRPSHVEDYHAPPGSLADLMQHCWESDSSERPTAKECWNEITRLHAEPGAVKPEPK